MLKDSGFGGGDTKGRNGVKPGSSRVYGVAAVRFVILRHATPPGGHYDLMFEQPGGMLRTWRLDRLPGRGWGRAVPLALHRPVYLHYEGPIWGRGWVRREFVGEYREAAACEGAFRAILFSDRLRGVLELERDSSPGGGWRCRMRG
jgi:hypothetical protein